MLEYGYTALRRDPLAADRMPSPLRDGGVYHPDLSFGGVLPAST
jgi:hypothetical protein